VSAASTPELMFPKCGMDYEPSPPQNPHRKGLRNEANTGSTQELNAANEPYARQPEPEKLTPPRYHVVGRSSATSPLLSSDRPGSDPAARAVLDLHSSLKQTWADRSGFLRNGHSCKSSHTDFFAAPR